LEFLDLEFDPVKKELYLAAHCTPTHRHPDIKDWEFGGALGSILKRFGGRLARYASIDILKTSSAEEAPAEEEDILATIKPCH
jgi:hypothetical protein